MFFGSFNALSRRLSAACLLCFVWAFAALLSTQAVPAAGGWSSAAQVPPRPAPEFTPGAQWLNTERPLSLRGLRGKVVLLDFWTYGCINCMHVLPDLKKLERKYANELVVISVHSPKFANENDTTNLRNALLRYNIEHPVLNDTGLLMWNAYGVNMWPTFVLIDPDGNLVGGLAGEGKFATIDRAVGEVAARFHAMGRLDRSPARFALEAARVPRTPLWYPGKVVAVAGSGGGPDQLFIADSNHNRIVIARADGKVEAVAGSGVAGAQDGAFASATFRNPQGMTLRRRTDGSQTLLVADMGNHKVRELDLKAKQVTTLAGDGRQASFMGRGAGDAKSSLSSPADLQLLGDRLYIAMAGTHQIWTMDLKSGRVLRFAGSGEEGRRDGVLSASTFAQPWGLAAASGQLFVADCESSTIRTLDLAGGKPTVRTLAGGDLFAFGDVDGVGDAVRLQHPLAVAYGGSVLYVADSYNHKLKTLNPQTRQVRSFLGGGRGDRDGSQPQFYEPGGLSIVENRLYVADTNNHKIRLVDLKTRSTSTVTLKDLPAPAPAEPGRAPAGAAIRSNS